MCNWIIIFLLFCNGGLGGNSRANEGCGCGNSGRGNDWDNGSGRSNDWGNGNGRSHDNDDCGCDNNNNRGGRGNGYDNRDWDYDRNRSGNTPPPWVRSNYSNGDTCGCEEQ